MHKLEKNIFPGVWNILESKNIPSKVFIVLGLCVVVKCNSVVDRKAFK